MQFECAALTLGVPPSSNSSEESAVAAKASVAGGGGLIKDMSIISYREKNENMILLIHVKTIGRVV